MVVIEPTGTGIWHCSSIGDAGDRLEGALVLQTDTELADWLTAASEHIQYVLVFRMHH